MEATRVVIAAPRTLFRQGLVALISSRPEFVVAGEASSADEARRLAAREQPEMVVLDSELQEGQDGCDTIACLRAECSKVVIVVIGEADIGIGSETEADEALRAERASVLQHGAAAYLPARADSSELLRVLTTLAALQECREDTADEHTASAGSRAENGPTGASKCRITEREKAIIAMIAQGLCNKEVAHRLAISTQTVKNHVSHLLEKLSLADRTQLAVYAIEHHFEF